MNLEISAHSERAAAQLAALETSDAMARLAAAKALREVAQDLERACARAAHEAGITWGRIGQLYGATRQAMFQRFSG